MQLLQGSIYIHILDISSSGVKMVMHRTSDKRKLEKTKYRMKV